MTRVLGYVRCSTGEQADSGLGLQAQRAAILAEAARRGWDEVVFVEDLGASGKDMHRPGIQAALEALRRGRADTLVVAKVDRLSRSLLDFVTLMQTATKEHWALVALDLGFDPTTATGRAMASIVATFSQLERELIGQRTREALRAKRDAGVRLGRPPVMDNAVIARMRSLRAEGATYQQIADAMNASLTPTARGGKSWYASTVSKALGRS